MFRNSLFGLVSSGVRKIAGIKKLNVIRSYGSQVVTGTDKCSTPHSRGLVLGVYSNEEDKLDLGCLTDNGLKYNEVRQFKIVLNKN